MGETSEEIMAGLDVPAGAKTPSGGAVEYEFTDAEGELIRKLAGFMYFVAVVGFVAAVLGVLTGVVFLLKGAGLGAALPPIVQAVIGAVLAAWLLRASHAFRAVADTEGNDIAHLMRALDELRKYFKLHAVLICVAMAALLVALLFGTLLMAAR